MYTHGTSTGVRLRTLAICRLEMSLTKLPLVYYPRCHTQKVMRMIIGPQVRYSGGLCCLAALYKSKKAKCAPSDIVCAHTINTSKTRLACRFLKPTILLQNTVMNLVFLTRNNYLFAESPPLTFWIA